MNDNEALNHQAILVENLLAAPLIAAASANSEMAKKQAKFLMDSCFDSDNGVFTPKMISMSVKSNNPSDEIITFQLPLITILPFNSLCVTDVSVKFDLEIISHQNLTTNDDQNNTQKMQMRGSISSPSNNKNQNQRRNKPKMSVEINGGSIPLPIGLTTLLEFYSKNIQLKS